MIPADLDITALPVGHLPVVRAAIDALGFKAVVDKYLPKHPLAHASDAECVIAMVLNILSGRLALWHQDTWLQNIDCELLLGAGVDPKWFHDTRLARALDAIDAVGTDTLLTEVVQRYLRDVDPRAPYSVHLDTTTASVYGAYDLPANTDGPVPLHGYSKDKRPDLKQLVFGLSIHGSAGIPLTMSVTSGNTADPVSNRDHLSRLAGLLPNPDAATIVADCKAVDAQTLGQLLRDGFHVISLVPDNHNVRRRCIENALAERADPLAWPVLAEKPGARKADLPLCYRGFSVSDTIRVAVPEAPPAGAEAAEAPKKRPLRRRAPEAVPAPEAEDEKTEARLISSNRPMRFLVVHSDALLRRFDESLAAKLDRQREAVEKRARATLGEGFACRADALEAAARLDGTAEWLKVEAEAVEVTERVKRARAGRPKKDELPEFKTRFKVELKLEPDEAAIAEARRRAGCFVLISDWTVDQRPDADILAEYRHQALVEGHTGFRWLKGPGAVAPVFLETPTRIRALGLVLVLALMVRNFIQFRLRREMVAQKKPVLHPLRKKADDHLTTEMALLWFAGQVSTLVQLGDGPAVRGRVKLGDEAKKVLELLGFSVDIYARPPPR